MQEQLAQSPEVTFRPATSEDGQAVAKAFLASSRSSYTDTAKNKGFGNDWVEAELRALTSKYGESYWGDLIEQAEASQGGQLFMVSEGFSHEINGLMYLKRNDDSVWVDAIYLSPEIQGRGVGGHLLKRAEEFADGLPLELDVMQGNQKAIGFYGKHGFKQSSEVFKRKPDTPPVFLMKKDARGAA
jgi:GNAT superfamily N-acetyltransferase